MNISIIGTGAYGSAMANLLLNSGNKVTMWTEKKNLDEIMKPDGAVITNDYTKCLESANAVFILTAAKFVPQVLRDIKEIVEKKDLLVILGSKGILEEGLLEEILLKTIANPRYAIISGPSFAIDIAELEPLGFTIATKNDSDYTLIKNLFKNIKCEYTDDTKGVSLSGVLKNAYAIGSGILESFNYGQSTKYLYLTMVLNEMKKIFDQIGAKNDTANFLCGVGDLFMTCSSLNSRNYTFGNIAGLGTLEEKKNYLEKNTVEGYDNLKVLYKMFKEKSIEAPILNEIYNIVIKNSEKKKLISLLLS